jgi:hypothetical protein
LLPRVQYIINTSHHSIIGTSPMRLMFGGRVTPHRGLSFRGFNALGTVNIPTYLNDVEAKEQALLAASRRHQLRAATEPAEEATPAPFAVGDMVLLHPPGRPSSKLTPRWQGPFPIVAARRRTYALRVGEKEVWADVARLRLWHQEPNTISAEDALARDANEFIVEDIREHRGRGKNAHHLQFLVKWEGFPDEENTWEPYEHLRDTDVFQVYCRQHGIRF